MIHASADQQQALRDYDLGIDHGSRPGATRILADPFVIDALTADGWQVEPVSLPSPPPPEGYRLPDAGGALLRALADASERVGYAVVGHSVEGRAIEAVWIGQRPESGAPVHRILGAHHGDEYPSFEVALAAAEALAAGDGSDPAITALLDAVTIWIVPYVNPDGVQAALRFNANGVDLNRNYDFPWNPDEYHPGPTAFSEPETRAGLLTLGGPAPAAEVVGSTGQDNQEEELAASIDSASFDWRHRRAKPFKLSSTPPQDYPGRKTRILIGFQVFRFLGFLVFWY